MTNRKTIPSTTLPLTSNIKLEGDLQRVVLLISKGISLAFRQSYYPLIATFVLLHVSYLRMLSFSFRLMILAEVFLCTFAMPYILGRLFDRINRHYQLVTQRRYHSMIHNFLAYVGTMVCIHLLQGLHMPFFLQGYLWVAMLYQIACMLISLFWNISTQSAAAGSVVGALSAYSLLMDYNAIWWICLSIFVCGLVNTSRMLLRKHTLNQVIAGTWIGFAASALVFILI